MGTTIENFLINLAELHFMFGFIGIDEFHERMEVACWLDDENDSVSDPRCTDDNDSQCKEDIKPQGNDNGERESPNVTISQTGRDDNWLEFLCLGIWVFTKSDPDSYPSVPHGHYQDKNAKWPKLNPYTGRAFSSKHTEDRPKRLTKSQMRIIWRDEKFRSFCREMIVWYQEQFPYFAFPVCRPLRLPIW